MYSECTNRMNQAHICLSSLCKRIQHIICKYSTNIYHILVTLKVIIRILRKINIIKRDLLSIDAFVFDTSELLPDVNNDPIFPVKYVGHIVLTITT